MRDLRHALWALAERKARKAIAGQDFGNKVALRSEFFKLMSKRTGKSVDVMEDWYLNTYMPNMVEVLRRHYKARPGAVEMIEELRRQGAKVVVLSDYPCTTQRLIAIGLGSLELMSWSTEELGVLKPSKEAFIAIADKVGEKVEDCVVVGDRADTDAAGAVRAGMRCVMIKNKKSANVYGFKELEWEDLKKELVEMAKEASRQ